MDFPRLDGGLNLRELDYRLGQNQSPEMKNLWWQDGVLQCRDGQEHLAPAPEAAGQGYACYGELFWGHAFFHIGGKLWYLAAEGGGDHPALTELYDGVSRNRGTFFRYHDWLFYKNRGSFVRITYQPGNTPVFSAADAAEEAYVPVTVINADPATGAGSVYQPENRLSPRKTVWYNAAAGVKVYRLPVGGIDGVTEVRVDGTVKRSGTDYTVDTAAGTVTFAAAPAAASLAVNNTVAITYSRENPEARASIMDCPYAAVYGGDANVCMVLGGCGAQPNAFFWNGNDDRGMNASYFPMPFYNLAGDTEDAVTGFGRQYGDLIVFKEHSIGRAGYTVQELEGRNSISLTYTAINSGTGCDLPWTIQLIENNLVFCNTHQGVHLIRDSSAAYENNILCISQNVNGTAARPGLLKDLAGADRDGVCSVDDDARYWVCANGHAYVWDYALSGWREPSWFYFTNIPAASFFRAADSLGHLGGSGAVSVFRRAFLDYGEAIEKVYRFPAQFFGSYDRLKDVLSVLFSVRSDTDTEVRIQYQSDYEIREDQTDIRSFSWRLSPRNLDHRYLAVRRFAHVARRKPGCRHVRHFTMRLSNNQPSQDLAVISAQIDFRYLGRER